VRLVWCVGARSLVRQWCGEQIVGGRVESGSITLGFCPVEAALTVFMSLQRVRAEAELPARLQAVRESRLSADVLKAAA
jgi:hypothetical protein